MVECTWQQYDSMFDALGDKTRRDILWRVSQCELSISEIAARYSLTFAAISKHIKVLEKASLVRKRRDGKEQIVSANKQTVGIATDYLKQYEKLWSDRFDRLETVLKEEYNE